MNKQKQTMLIIDFIWVVGSKKNRDGSEKNRSFESSAKLSYLSSLASLSVLNLLSKPRWSKAKVLKSTHLK